MNENIDVANLHWEDFDDQDPSEWEYVGYKTRRKGLVVEPIASDFTHQIDEIRRLNGKATDIILYRH